MKLRSYDKKLNQLYEIYYVFHESNIALSYLLRNSNGDVEMYSGNISSNSNLTDISTNGKGVYTRQQIEDFIKERPSYYGQNVYIEDIVTKDRITISQFLDGID